MSIGIYEIKNKVNNKKYIGQSIQLIGRINDHIYKLKRNDHRNTHLQNSFNKHGIDNFDFNIITNVSESDLDRYERVLIKRYRCCDPNFGYNHDTGGNKNKHLSEETKYKISESCKGKNNGNPGRKGQPHTEETKRKMSESAKTRKRRSFSKQARKNIGDAHIGNKHSEETKQKMRESSTGQKHSEETKRKISKARCGSKMSAEARKNMSIARTGKKRKPLSEETKRKISETLKQKHKDNKCQV